MTESVAQPIEANAISGTSEKRQNLAFKDFLLDTLIVYPPFFCQVTVPISSNQRASPPFLRHKSVISI